MKKEILEITPQFIINQNGKKTGVLLDMTTFEQMIEKLEEFYLGTTAEAILKDESEFVDFEELKKKILK